MTATDEPSIRPEATGLLVRPARAADAAAIAGLVRSPEDLAQVSPDESYPLDPATVRHWIETRRGGYVLEQRGTVVGYAEIVDDARASDRVWIGHMMVAPARRGVGFGKTMVRALQRIAEDDRGAREVAISAFADNTRALACYRNCDFRDRGTHRVHDRTLQELRYLVPGRRPRFPLAITLALGLASAIITLLTMGPDAWAALVALPTVAIVPLVAWAAHGILPVRRERPDRRWLRVVAYLATVAAAAWSVVLVMSLAAEVDHARAGLLIGVSAVGWAGLMFVHDRWIGARRSPR